MNHRAYTLVELLLVVVLLLGLTVLAAIHNGQLPNNQLAEGAGCLKTLITYARSTAEIKGRVVRIEFTETDGIRVVEQANPLDPTSPLVESLEAASYVASVNQLVTVTSEMGLSDDQPAITMTCWPDGSLSTSGSLIVAAKSDPTNERLRLLPSGSLVNATIP